MRQSVKMLLLGSLWHAVCAACENPHFPQLLIYPRPRPELALMGVMRWIFPWVAVSAFRAHGGHSP